MGTSIKDLSKTLKIDEKELLKIIEDMGIKSSESGELTRSDMISITNNIANYKGPSAKKVIKKKAVEKKVEKDIDLTQDINVNNSATKSAPEGKPIIPENFDKRPRKKLETEEDKKPKSISENEEKAVELKKDTKPKTEDIKKPKETPEVKKNNLRKEKPAVDKKKDSKNVGKVSPKMDSEIAPKMGSTDIKPSKKPSHKKSSDSLETDKFVKQSTKSSKKKKNQYSRGDKPERFKNYDVKIEDLEKFAKPKKSKPNKAKKEEVEEIMEVPSGAILINVPITVGGLSEQLSVSVSDIIMSLMKMGVMATVNQNLDEETVILLSEDLNLDVVIGQVSEEAIEEGVEDHEDHIDDLQKRSPIITVMGHVDHGKTSLLDAIRKTNVTDKESGGITQHIGASEIVANGEKIVFLDTPGHEAFTAMRARGAHVTDIAVLVVAADDSVKPQTIESISHAKAAGVPIIVAINKIDKPGANPDKVKSDLIEHGILVEEYGGEIISVPVSAKTGDGIKDLLEMILLQAEVLELKANPDRLATGTVIEAQLDKAKGPVTTLLVLNGTLKVGDSVVAGTTSGKIRLMSNHKGEKIEVASPGTAVEILGLSDIPHAGDKFHGVKTDKVARDIAEQRQTKLREEVLAKNSTTSLETLFNDMQSGSVKELKLIVKGDVQGSVGAIVSSLEKLSNDDVKVKIIYTGVGAVNESDVMLASTSEAIIIGFNVRPSSKTSLLAQQDDVEIRLYRVIYNIIDDIEKAMTGLLDPEFEEIVLGKVEIRNTFKVPVIGTIGGGYVLEGKILRNAEIRLVREGIVVHEGSISSLKRFKDDAKEVKQGFECGIGIENYGDIKEGDILECFEMQEIKREY